MPPSPPAPRDSGNGPPGAHPASPPPMWAMVHAAVYAVSVSFLFVFFLSGGSGWAEDGNAEVGVGAPSWGHRKSCLLTPSLPLPFLPSPYPRQ